MEYGATFNAISGTIAYLIFLKTLLIEMSMEFLIGFYVGPPSQPNSVPSQPTFTCSKLKGEIYSKLTIGTPERYQWRRSDVFIVNFKHISHLVLVFLLLTLSI